MWFVCDPFGIICAALTYGLIGYANLTLSFCYILPWMTYTWPIHFFLFNLLTFLATSSHLACMLSNPGALPIRNSNGSVCSMEYEVIGHGKSQNIVPTCKKCNSAKPPRAHHCSTCGRCIMKMDHHCPWVNNCVGQNTQKHFILFLFYINTLCLYCIGILSYRFLKCVGGGENRIFRRHSSIKQQQHLLENNDTEKYSCMISPICVILGAFCFMEGLIFGLFTAIMLCDQFAAILTNMTGVEQLKKEKFENNRTTYQCLIEVFGCSFSWKWFLPTPLVIHPKKQKDDIEWIQNLEWITTEENNNTTSCVTEDNNFSSIQKPIDSKALDIEKQYFQLSQLQTNQI